MVSVAGRGAWVATLLSAIAVICIGVSTICFARKYVASGSLYSYVGFVYGPSAKWVTGSALLLGYIVQVSGIAGLTAMFLGSFLVNFGVLQSSSVSVEVAIFAVVTGLGAYVSYRGLDASIRVTVFLCAISVPFIAFITFAVANHTGLQLETQFDLSAIDIKAVIQGVATGAVFLVAFESCTSLAAETQNPKKNIPWAVMSVPVVLGATYLLCTFLQTPGLMEVKDEIAAGTSAPAALAHLAGLPSWVGMLTDAVFSLALFASMVGFLNYGARFLMALSSECFLPLAIQSRGNKWGTPGVAIWTLAISGFVVMAFAALLIGNLATAYSATATLCVFAWIPPYVLICIGAIRLAFRGVFRKTIVVPASLFGGATMVWAYANFLLSPPASTIDAAMSWVIVLILVFLMGVFFLVKRVPR